MKAYWISWYDTRSGEWELHFPWWVSGERVSDGAKTICAAVMVAESPEEAKQLILDAHDEDVGDLEWRFIEAQEDDWSPFSDRFQRADWMKWHPVVDDEGVV